MGFIRIIWIKLDFVNKNKVLGIIWQIGINVVKEGSVLSGNRIPGLRSISLTKSRFRPSGFIGIQIDFVNEIKVFGNIGNKIVFVNE